MKTIVLIILSICFSLVSNPGLAKIIDLDLTNSASKTKSNAPDFAKNIKSKSTVQDKSKQTKFLMCVKKSENYCAKHFCRTPPKLWCKKRS